MKKTIFLSISIIFVLNCISCIKNNYETIQPNPSKKDLLCQTWVESKVLLNNAPYTFTHCDSSYQVIYNKNGTFQELFNCSQSFTQTQGLWTLTNHDSILTLNYTLNASLYGNTQESWLLNSVSDMQFVNTFVSGNNSTPSSTIEVTLIPAK
jgi:hypothetical protein